jgi:hypothetical protein
VADVCPQLGADALRLALQRAGNTHDVIKYTAIVARLQNVDSRVQPDAAWVERVQRDARADLERLEHACKYARQAFIKEGIRVPL